MTESFRPGWYPKPDYHETLMWWDGDAWDHSRVAPRRTAQTVGIAEIAVGVGLGSFATAVVAYFLYALLVLARLAF